MRMQAVRGSVACGVVVLAGLFAAVAGAQQAGGATGASAKKGAGPQAAVDARPLAGTWIQVEREGKGYVIRQYCDSATPGFKLQPNGEWEMNYGQEDESLKLTALKPGAAGAFTLELTRTGGSKEKVEWTVADAKKGIARLKGGKDSFFRAGVLFVRDDKKAGLPVRREECDEEEEQ